MREEGGKGEVLTGAAVAEAVAEPVAPVALAVDLAGQVLHVLRVHHHRRARLHVHMSRSLVRHVALREAVVVGTAVEEGLTRNPKGGGEGKGDRILTKEGAGARFYYLRCRRGAQEQGWISAESLERRTGRVSESEFDLGVAAAGSCLWLSRKEKRGAEGKMKRSRRGEATRGPDL